MFNDSYNAITEVSNNLVLAVSLDNKYGYINESEENIIPFSYFEGTEGFNNKGYAIANSNNKYGIINLQGKEIIKPYYDGIKFDNNYFVMNSKKDGTLIRKISR